MFRILKINLLIFISLLFIMEISGQLLAFILNKKFLFNDPQLKFRSDLFSHHPYLSVTLNKNVVASTANDNQYHEVRTTEIGTRWTGADLKDKSKIRVACLGGSTTFCTGVTDEETWPALLQKELGDRYAVINYGVPAYKTSEGVIQMALYVPEMKPDYVVFYHGVNDMFNYYMEQNYPDYFFHAETLMPKALLGVKLNETIFEKLSRQSGIFYIINNISEKLTDYPMPKRHAEPDVVVDSLFTRNMRSMVALTNVIHAKPIVVSQVLNPHYDKVEELWSIRVKTEFILPFMSRMNGFGKSVCESDSGCMYLDFQNGINWKPEHFWDDMHFTKEGNAMFAKKLAGEIKSTQ